MPEKPEKTKIDEIDKEDLPGTPKPTWSEDTQTSGYYYDDAHGYEVFVPDRDDEDVDSRQYAHASNNDLQNEGSGSMEELREQLVQASLAWERAFGNAPLITTVLSEFDAARLVGCSTDSYSCAMQGITAVQKGHDFIFKGSRYQVKGNRPSGKPGSFVTWVPKATNYHWDYLV